jgi:hypothetical protein
MQPCTLVASMCLLLGCDQITWLHPNSQNKGSVVATNGVCIIKCMQLDFAVQGAQGGCLTGSMGKGGLQ